MPLRGGVVMKITMQIDLSKLRRGVNATLADIPRRTSAALNEIANEVAGEAQDLAPFKEGHLTESIRGEVAQDDAGKSAAVIYIPTNHQAASYAIKMHEETYNLGQGSLAKQQRVGKQVGRKFITRAMENKVGRIRRIIEYYFREK